MVLSRRQLLLSSTLAPLAHSLSALELSKIRLGVTTDEIDEDALTAVKFLREFNLGWAEVRNVWGKYNTEQPVEKIQELRKIFDENRIKLSILGTGFFKVPFPPETPEGNKALDAQWLLLDRAMERAKIMGTDQLRVFGFTYKNGEMPDKANYPRIYELLGQASKIAKAKGIRLAMENVNTSYVWSSKETADVLKHVKNDNFGLTWDPNNAAETHEKSYPEGYKRLDAARIFHVHLRDFKTMPDGKVVWCAVGDGEMDNVGQIRSLLKDGYKGAFTLETHYRSPQGKAHASRTSLTALLKVIEQV